MLHAGSNVYLLPPVGGRHSGVGAALEKRTVEVPMFFASRTPLRRQALQHAIVPKPINTDSMYARPTSDSEIGYLQVAKSLKAKSVR